MGKKDKGDKMIGVKGAAVRGGAAGAGLAGIIAGVVKILGGGR